MSGFLNDAKYQYMNIHTPGDVTDREDRENRRAAEMSRKLAESGLTLTANDLLGVDYGNAYNNMNNSAPSILTERDMWNGLSPEEIAEARSSSMLTEDAPPYAYHAGNDMFAEPQQSRTILNENGSPMKYNQRDDVQPQTSSRREATWTAQKMNAKLKSGNIVPVWKVVDSKTKMELPTPFRIEEVADKIVNVLNESGNANDPRVVSTISSYNKRVQIMKEMQLVKKQISEGSTSKKGRLEQLRSDLASVDYKLGI
jgi:hypothetical protein